MATTKVVSYSELDSYRQCRLKHDLAYRGRWKPKTEAPALSRGRLFHEVMEAWYRGFMSNADPTPEMLLYDRESGTQSEEQALVQWVFDGYRECYGLETGWEILDVEMAVEEWLPTERGTRSSFRLKGKVDLLIRDHTAGGGLWIVDHKTCRNLPRGKDLDLDDQMGLYTYLLRRRGVDIRGAIYNSCRTEKLKREMTMKERFQRDLTVRSDRELETVAAEVLDTFREAYQPSRTGELQPPRSPDPDRCGWRCPFTEPCLASRKDGTRTDTKLPDWGFHVDLTRH